MRIEDADACRKPTDSVNFVIAHDGFTLYDLVSYNEKHNDQNGEGNRSGSSMKTLHYGVQRPSQQCVRNRYPETSQYIDLQGSIRACLAVFTCRSCSYGEYWLALCAITTVLTFCRDGSNDNFSWNCGVEGETDDGKVNALRQSQMRNMHMALMLSQGTPMLLMGQPLCLCLLLLLSSPHAPSILKHSQMR